MTTKNITIIFTSLLLITALFSNAQINNPTYDELMWGDPDPGAKITTFPAKWKGESAVILYRSERYEFRKQVINNVINEDSYFRQRVILLDQTAVNEYSQFSIDNLNNSSWGRNADYIGLKIIKPDGSVRVITQSDFVEMKQDDGNGYRNRNYDKVALPNLSIGDIVDIYSVSIIGHNTDPNSAARITFDPVFMPLQLEYPIVNGKLTIKPERKTFFNASWLNGAPEPVIEKKNKWSSYVFEYGDLEKISVDQLVFPLREYPSIIYQIIIAPDYDKATKVSFLGKSGEIKNHVSDEEVELLLMKLKNPDRLETHSFSMLELGLNYIPDMLPVNYTNTDVAECAYYFLRHYLNFKTINYYGYTLSMNYFIDEFDFVTIYSSILKKFNIENEIGVCVPRTLGTPENLIIHDQLKPFILLKDTVSIYITAPETNSVFGEIDGYIEGSESTLINSTTSDRRKIIRKETIPVSQPEQNLQIDTVFVDIASLSPVSIAIKEKYYLTDFSKKYHQRYMATYYDTYNDEAMIYAKYNISSKKDLKYVKKHLESLEKHKDEYYAERRKIYDIILTQTQSVEKVEIDTLELINIGRWSNSDTLKYNHIYTINEGINKANNFYIINVGKLIGKNKEFTDEEIDRKTNIYIDTPHIVNWVLILNIPEGFEVQGYENLNNHVNNSTGTFDSKARISDDKLIIDISKIFKHNYHPLEKWPEMLEFLNAAVDFTQKQVLLVPN